MSLRDRIKKYIYGQESGGILMFHHVTDSPMICKSGCLLNTKEFYTVFDSSFQKFISLQQLLESSPTDYKGALAVTFDDGLEDIYTIAYPFLVNHQIPFTLFIVTDFLDTDGYITSAQLKEMAANPLITVGAHGVTHDILPGMTTQEKQAEISHSKKRLEDLLHKEISYFAYSHGQFDKECEKLVRKCGYKAAFAVTPRPYNRITGRTSTRLPRINIDSKSIATAIPFIQNLPSFR